MSLRHHMLRKEEVFPSAAYAPGTWFNTINGPTTDAGKGNVGLKNDAWMGIFIVVDITNANAGSVTVKLQGYDPVSTKWYDVPGCATQANTVAGTFTLLVLPGTIETANFRVSNILPIQWRLNVAVAATAPTFSIGAFLMAY